MTYCLNVLPVKPADNLRHGGLFDSESISEIDLSVLSGGVETSDLANVCLGEPRHSMCFSVDRSYNARIRRAKSSGQSPCTNDGCNALCFELTTMFRHMCGLRDQREITDRVVECISAFVVHDKSGRNRATVRFPNYLGTRFPCVWVICLNPRPWFPLLIRSYPNVANPCMPISHINQYNMPLSVLPC